MGKSTISMAIFNSYVTNYQRVEVVQFYGDRMKMAKYIHHEFMIIDVGLDYHEKNRDMTGWRFQHVQRCCFFYHPPKRETSSLFSFFSGKKEHILDHFSTTHMGSSKDLVTQNPIVYHCSSSKKSSVFRLTLQSHAPHSGTPTSEQDVVYLAMAISATELQKAVQGFVQDSARCLFV